MDFYGNRYTDVSENIGDTQDVTRETVKIETSRIPFSEFIKVVRKRPLKPDNTVDYNSNFSYYISDSKTGDVIDTIFRSFNDKTKPLFIYIPFKGKDYIVTSTAPGLFSIVCCTDRKTYDRSLEVDGKKVIPISASARIRTNSKNEDEYVCITFLCKFVGNDETEYKNVTVKLDNMCTSELFSTNNMSIEDAEIKEEDLLTSNI